MSKLPALVFFTRRTAQSPIVRKSLLITLAVFINAPIAFAILHRAAAMLA